MAGNPTYNDIAIDNHHGISKYLPTATMIETPRNSAA
jgi:hypothetical protein